MKREGSGYPGNVGHRQGTNCQEVMRVLIDRIKYLDQQIPCGENKGIIRNLQTCIALLELRAAKRHQVHLDRRVDPEGVEQQVTRLVCGHIFCGGHV